MSEYHLARERINQYIRHSSGSLKADLDLLAKERALETFKLIKGWAEANHSLVPDFHTYVDFSDIEKKLGIAYRKYWHFVYIYRSFHALNENIVYSKILSFEYYFFERNGVLSKTGTSPAFDKKSQNFSQNLFYESPLSHFLNYKVLTELLSRIKITADKINLINGFIAFGMEFFLEFEKQRDPNNIDYFDLKNHMLGHNFFSSILELIDKK